MFTKNVSLYSPFTKSAYKKLDNFEICMEMLVYCVLDKKDFYDDQILIKEISTGLKGKGNCITSSCYIASELTKEKIKFRWVCGENISHYFIVVETDHGMILMDATRTDILKPLFILESSIYDVKSKLQFFFQKQKFFQFKDGVCEGFYGLETVLLP